MGTKDKIAVASLGCDKNRVDTEIMLGLLTKAGFLITAKENEADVLLVNTCSFIGDAREESINTILSLALNKKKGKCKSIIVTGCLAQRYPQELLDEMPEIDAVVGTGKIAEIADVAHKTLAGEKVFCVGEPGDIYQRSYPRILTTPRHYAYLKIADGCDNRCSYCIIPRLRGSYRSRPFDDVIAEAENLAGGGVKELILVAQDTTRYGRDLYGDYHLPDLLESLNDIKGISWIRLLYAYPNLITEKLISAMATSDKVCKYIDIPMQHASPTVLRAMGRPSDKDKMIRLVERLRERIPGITVRSTFIVGFPGETEDDFQQLLSFMQDVKLDRVGIFTYSREEGTPAAALAGQIPPRVKADRYKRAMQIQAKISKQRNLHKVGLVKAILVEEALTASRAARICRELDCSTGEYCYAGRSEGDAPGVDGAVYFTSAKTLTPGNFVSVKITKAKAYDLYGLAGN